MRRLAVVAVLVGLSLAGKASADPFENLSNSLEYYDRQLEKREGSSGGKSAVRQASAQSYRRPAAEATMGPGRSRSARPAPPARTNSAARMSGRPVRQAQAAMPEEVTPEPMPQEEIFYDEGYYPGEMWQEPMGDCYDGSCGVGCGWCKPGFWGRAEYLFWWVRGAYIPPLVTTSPDGTLVNQAGVLPNATILFGDQRINESGRSGGRFTLGYWFDPCETLGIENTFFFIGGESDGYTASSSGSPILARPFFNTDSQEQDAILIAYPNVVVGGINITSSRNIYSNEINLRRSLYSDSCRRLDILAGYRYMRLSESLDIYTNSSSLETASLGTQFAVNDSFDTANNFNGGQLGVNLQWYRGCWTIDLLGKLALGGVSQRALINGSTSITDDGDSITYDGGMLALPSNSGQHDQTTFGVVPEFGVNLRYQWSPLWRVSVGYTFMALTNVLRPGDQIDLDIDPNQFPPGDEATFPSFAFNESDIWLQGINLGIECNF